MDELDKLLAAHQAPAVGDPPVSELDKLLAAHQQEKPRLITSHPPPPQQRDDTSVSQQQGPGLLSRAVSAVGGVASDLFHHPQHIVTQPLEAATDALFTPVEGSAASGIGGRGGRATLPEGAVVTHENTPGAITDDERKKATLQTLLNVGGGTAGSLLAKPLGRVVGEVAGNVIGRHAANTASGVVQNPGDPVVGGITGLVTGEALHHATGGVAPVLEKVGGVEYRNSGLSVIPETAAKLKTAFARAFTDPHAEIAGAHPELHDALMTAGAASDAAQHLATRRAGWVMEGMTPEQQQVFGKKLVYDNLIAEAKRKRIQADDLAPETTDEPPSLAVRDETGKLRRNLSSVTDDELRSELARLSELNGSEEGAHSAIQESGYREAYLELPDTERNGARGQEDLPDADGEMDPDVLDQHNKFVKGFNRTQVVRDARAKSIARIQSELDSRNPDETPLDDEQLPEGATDFGPPPDPTAQARALRSAAQRFAAHAQELAPQIPEGTETEPWFQPALERHRQYIEPNLTAGALGAGVSPESFREPASAYLKLISEDRLHNKEVRRAMDAAAVTDPQDLSPRSPFVRSLIGENPALRRLFPAGANDLRVGPLTPGVPSTGTDTPIQRQGASRTGSAMQATGSARQYVTDYGRIINQDALDKIVRAAKNNVYSELDKIGRPLGPNEEPALGKQAVSRTVLDENGQPQTKRWEVSPDIKRVIDRFEKTANTTDQTGNWRKFTSAMTRLQISGMPVEATSHMNSLASIVAAVPGEMDATNKVLSAVPMVGAKIAAIREMKNTDFSDPETRALESRLADIGALRANDERGGLINTGHKALFGPEGVDVRGRLALARKYLAAKPDATDEELRQFVVGKLGNYVRGNSGSAINALQDSGLSSFARFQAARIPTGIKTSFGMSGLPNDGTLLGKSKNVANTLWRGPLGYAAGATALNYALTGHGPQDNEKGHQTDIQLPFHIGAHSRPVYLPTAFLNPILATGMRATGLRDFLPFPGHANGGGMAADASRDAVNTGLGVLSPAVRSLSIAASGRTPYLNSDGSMLRVTDPKFNKGSQMTNNVKSAFSLGNPALAAFAQHGGDVGGNSLSDALSEDGRRFGGPTALASRVAEFLAPRVATVGVGGADAETSNLRRDEREYNDVMLSYKGRLRRAPGPKSEDSIIEDAVRDATSDGRFSPEQVRAELVKYVNTPPEKRDRAQERGDQTFTRRKLR